MGKFSTYGNKSKLQFLFTFKLSLKFYISVPIAISNHLITESEVVTGKSQTEALPY